MFRGNGELNQTLKAKATLFDLAPMHLAGEVIYYRHHHYCYHQDNHLNPPLTRRNQSIGGPYS